MILIYGKGKVGSGIATLCDSLGISYEQKDDTDTVDYNRYDTIIPSPSIPSHHDVYKTGKVKSELDFAYGYLPKGFHIIAVTGTDGKSTTSWILSELLRKEYGNEKVYLSGNFDIPFSQTVREILEKKQKTGYIVLEVSSFMSYMIRSFRSEYAVFTNFKPDHLNWHRDLSDYFEAKMRLMYSADKKVMINLQVLDFASEHGIEVSPPEQLRIYQGFDPVSSDPSLLKKDRTDGEDIIVSGRKKYQLSETHFSGRHNAENILSVALVANELGICSKRVKKYLEGIYSLPHRLEIIGEKNGVTIVEDSKSTSAQSLGAALTSFGSAKQKNLLLIVGGSDKGDSFDSLGQAFADRVKAMVTIGATKELFSRIAEKENIEYLSTDSLSLGVEWLYKKAKKGDVLMLSPGCASFGLFRDYLDRADQFREAIKKLP